MSGTASNLTVIGFPGVGAWPSFGLFTPTSNDASAYNPISPDFLAAASLSLQQEINNSVASIQNQGFSEFIGAGQLFSRWADYQNTFSTNIGNVFADAESKSAKACSGFFSCLFG